MPYRHWMAQLALILILLAVGCESGNRAQKYTADSAPFKNKIPAGEPEKVVLPGVPATDGWMEESPRLDIPIRFISEKTDATEWAKLPGLWNEYPGPAGIYTLALGLSPLEAVIAFRLQVTESVIKIKVPRGLPKPSIPAANPPTYGKWALGKKLFFDKLLVLSTSSTCSCASCHDPQQGFTLHTEIPIEPIRARRNVPSLINSVYNRHQFWDGRAKALEQVLLRQLDDEKPLRKDPPFEKSPGYLHVWPGMITKLGRADYFAAFQRVFGNIPTADSVAKALATYMRTILSGDSLYDRAEQHRLQRQGTQLEAKDFEANLPRRNPKASAQDLVKGYDLFMGIGRCVKCHPAPLFTDHGFHNIGIGESSGPAPAGKEPGRFSVTPYGLKHRDQIGAFKTPTLRNLPLTGPYMHDGSLATLKDVLAYYNAGIGGMNLYLDAELSMGPLEPRRFGFSPQEMEALELFLRSLQGDLVPAIISEPARK